MPKVAAQLLSRPPWERMMLIHERIKAGDYPNCRKLAREIEVCPRTVKRDVDFMKYRLDLPIEYDELKYGYYYSQAVDRFPQVVLTEAETFALLVAHKAIAQYRGTPFERPLATAFRRLTGQLNHDSAYSIDNLSQALSFRPLAPEDTDLKNFEALTTAVQRRRVVRFQYRNLGKQRSQARKVRPYHLACVENHWYLFAYDLDRQDMRTFALTRLREAELTSETFKLPKDFDPDEYLKGSFTVFKGTGDFEVVVDFDPWAADLIRGRRWHESQEVTDLPGGSLRLRMHLNSIEEMVGWVLSWGTHATVVRPKALIDKVLTSSRRIAQRYAKGTRVQDLGATAGSGPARQLSLADSWSNRRKAP